MHTGTSEPIDDFETDGRSMTDFGRQMQASGLKLREADTYWEGMYDEDMQFLVRRSKSRPQDLSDLHPGSLSESQVEHLLAAFIVTTGGIGSDKIVFATIAKREQPNEEVVLAFDRAVRIGKNVAALLRRVTTNTFLAQDGSSWNAVLVLLPLETPLYS